MIKGAFMKSFRLYTDVPDLVRHKVWAEIDTRALQYNYKLLCAMTPGVQHICAVTNVSAGLDEPNLHIVFLVVVLGNQRLRCFT